MKKVTKTGAILRWKDELVEVIATSEGRVVYMQPLGGKPCKCCGETREYAIVESSPLFQDNAEAIITLES